MSKIDEQLWWATMLCKSDEKIEQRLMINVDQQSNEKIFMCRVEFGYAADPYDCLQE